jgi:hypothetical protein
MLEKDKYTQYKNAIYGKYDFNVNDFARILSGGKAESDGKTIVDFDLDQIIRGIKVEFEHTDSVNVSIAIVLDHLAEFSNYYDALAKMELTLAQNPQNSKIEGTSNYKRYQERIQKEYDFDIDNFTPRLRDGVFETHKRKITDFDLEQIVKGIKVEYEHSSETNDALDIALDHLDKFYNYYDGLEKMEKELKKSLVSESPVRCHIDNGKALKHDDYDSIAFAYHNGMFYDSVGGHSDLADKISQIIGEPFYTVYSNFTHAGRV